MSKPSPVWVDDRDPRVKFNGVWPIGGSPNEFEETVSSSTRVGDSFVVPFYGQYIVVYGTIDATSGGVVTNYSIDGAPPIQVTSMAGADDTAHQQFWMSPFLNITQHELVVTMAKVNPDPELGEGTIWFDYFVIDDPSGHEKNVSPKHKLSKGGIAGVVIGVLVFVAIIAACLVLWFKRRQTRRRKLLNGVITEKVGGDSDRTISEGGYGKQHHHGEGDVKDNDGGDEKEGVIV